MTLAETKNVKHMKLKIVIPLIALVFLSSCIVKSLHPFYTKDKIVYNEHITGSWEDSKKGIWEIISFKDEWEKESKSQTKLAKEDRELYEKFKYAYVVTYTKNESNAEFIVTPFEIDNELYLNFTPFYYDSGDLNGLVAQHLFKTHSAAKVAFQDDGGFHIQFLSEERVKPLFTENKIRLKHENAGVDEDLLLTAPSEELYQFLRQFNASDIENRWTKDVYKLSKTNAKP